MFRRTASVHGLALNGYFFSIRRFVRRLVRRILPYLNHYTKWPQGPVVQADFPVATINDEAMVVEVSRSAMRLLNLRKMDLPIHFAEVFGNLGQTPESYCRTVFEAKELLKPTLVTAQLQAQDSYVQLSWLPHDKTRRMRSALITDATELKCLETQFIQGQKMQAIGQLAGGIAHDFNNVLTAISGYCDLLLLDKDRRHADYDDLMEISENAGRAAELVQHLLAFSRRQKLDLQPISLNEIVSQMSSLLNRLVGEKVALHFDRQTGLPRVMADARQLEQVFMNLIVNARDAMPEGGMINVTTRTERFDDVFEHDDANIPAGNYVIVEVSDTGIGMSRSAKRKVFEPFYTTKKTGEGTGLGLSTVYGIVKQTGGFVVVDSALGEGTAFKIFFPASDKVEDRRASKTPTDRPRDFRLEKAKILIVEDEEPVRIFATRALSQQGAEVMDVPSGEAALDLLKSAEFVPDVIVSDIVMPGMNGPDWVREARKTMPDLNVIFVSGYSNMATINEEGRLDGADFLPKPYSLGDLISAVQSHVNT